MACLEDERHALVFRAEVSGIPLKELTMCERIKMDLLRGLASGCAHLKGITELSKAMGAKV
jgi:hypothetical protein